MLPPGSRPGVRLSVLQQPCEWTDLNQFRRRGDEPVGSNAVEPMGTGIRIWVGALMHLQRILLASSVLALSLVPVGALAQAVNEPPATFNERYPAEPLPQMPVEPPISAQPTGTAQQKSTEQSTHASTQRGLTAPVRAARAEVVPPTRGRATLVSRRRDGNVQPPAETQIPILRLFADLSNRRAARAVPSK